MEESEDMCDMRVKHIWEPLGCFVQCCHWSLSPKTAPTSPHSPRDNLYSFILLDSYGDMISFHSSPILLRNPAGFTGSPYIIEFGITYCIA